MSRGRGDTVAAQPLVRPTVLVALGGALGVLARYVLSGWLDASLGGSANATLAVNIVGAFILGLAVASLGHDHRWFPLVGPGLLGGFTTYSSLAVSALLLSDSATGNYTPTLLYALGSVVAGLAAAVAGVWAGERTARAREVHRG